MAEINMGSVWKVTMTEYDDGAQRPMGTKYFDNETEARNFCRDYNVGGSASCYYRASYEKI
jgi:hypothetical protein